MARPATKLVGMTISITDKAKLTLERQARERGLSSSVWAGQVFDLGFAAVCAREKSMPVSDGDLDALVGGALLLWSRGDWNTDEIAAALGVPESTVVRILDAWKAYRRGEASATASVGDGRAM